MPHNQPAANALRAVTERAMTINKGVRLIQAKNQRSKSGNESIVSSADPETSDASAGVGRLDLIADQTRDSLGRVMISRSVTPRV